MKRNILTILFTLLSLLFTQAHEFWLRTNQFRYKVGETMIVDFVVGENFTGELWDMSKHRVEKLEVHAGTVVKNLVKDIKATKGKNFLYKFDKEGTHLIGLQGFFDTIELEGEKFNAYLKEDGLDEVLSARTRNGDLGKPAKEYYTRYAKLLVQSGTKYDEVYKKRLGFRYEIIPLSNPNTLKSGDYLECRVLYEGKESPHSLVKVWSHVGNRIFLQNIYTEDDGTIKFPISSSGPWMVSSVKMIQSTREGADYESMWASLVFGIDSK